MEENTAHFKKLVVLTASHLYALDKKKLRLFRNNYAVCSMIKERTHRTTTSFIYFSYHLRYRKVRRRHIFSNIVKGTVWLRTVPWRLI